MDASLFFLSSKSAGLGWGDGLHPLPKRVVRAVHLPEVPRPPLTLLFCTLVSLGDPLL